ncbi:amidohydrolase [Halosimplex carlsbadense 2-9-1]|uniref:Amidohydrolase n=2 Tax=Halosimplex carlsbadense TaxID=171164 RepID=M0CY48_9EURY|nr:amidohydrolase [Halosimplex carlsbadense 2-9-1]
MRRASVAIRGEQIVAVGQEADLPDAERRIDASGKVVMPGVVDPHVHVDEVPENRAGTMPAETAAAALGGVTTFIDFAFQGGDRRIADESKDLLDGIEHKRSKADQSYVDYGLHGVLHREDPETFEELGPAIDMGVTSFKMFMSNYEVGISNGFMIEAFEELADHDAVAAMHTEDPSICDALTAKLQREGKGASTHYPDSRPDYCEAMAAEDAVRAAVEHGVKYYGVHTTCRDSAEVIRQFQADQSTVRAETCTHYTALDRSAYATKGNLPIIAPPLRTEDDQDAMFEYLDDGTLTVVSTDHSVYHEKYKHTDDWWDAPFGANSLQYSLPVFHEVAVNQRDHSLPFLVRVLCTNPAQTFGMPRKGTLEPGTDADVVVFDPSSGGVISAEDNASNSTFSIYEGMDVSGSVEKTFVRGELVVDDGSVVAETGTGEFVERDLPDWSP